MNLRKAAEEVRKQGRNGDTMLVHMHPNEVAGLEALARWNGGKLTTNPKTGQPEAFFLAALLPALIGAAGTAAGVSPWLMAGGTALAGTLATGSLSKGLMMGLGAFGGAGLAGGIANAGVKSLAGAGTAGAEAAGTAAAAQAAARTANAASNAFPSANALSTASNAARTSGNMAADISQRVGQGVLTAPQNPTFAQNFSQNVNNMGQGLKTMVQNPSHFMERSGGPLNLAMNTGMAAAPFLDPSNMQRKIPGRGPENDMNLPRLSDDFFARPVYSGEPVPIIYPERQFNAGGITSLGMYSDGGQTVVGPGDGMSDTVPATIGGVQPARLSTDEFVVPADVVSHLGNGSSRAGAAKLYQMMDRVREARTGQDGQAPQINSERMIPV